MSFADELKKLTTVSEEDRKRASQFSSSSQYYFMLGGLALAMSAMLLMGGLMADSSEKVGVIAGSVLAAVGGLALLLLGKKANKAKGNYVYYSDIIVNEGVKDIREIASIVGKDEKQVLKDLDALFKKGRFQGHINKSKMTITFRKAYSPDDEIKISSIEFIPAKCNGCGAENKVPAGQLVQCKFCDAPILKEAK